MRWYYIVVWSVLSVFVASAMNVSTCRIKLDDGITSEVPVCIVSASNTLYKKQLWKDYLKINPRTPIIMNNLSPNQLGLFYKALTIPINQFKRKFFDGLSYAEKKALISASGKDSLNSPLVTSLLAQSYFPQDIVALISYFCKDIKDDADHSMRSKMIQNNLLRPALSCSSIYTNKIIDLSLGRVLSVPNGCITQSELCDTNYIFVPQYITVEQDRWIDSDDNDIPKMSNYYLTLLHSKNDTHEHCVTLDNNKDRERDDDALKKILLWRKCAADAMHHIKKVQLPHKLHKAIMTNTGSHIAISMEGQCVLWWLDTSSKDIYQEIMLNLIGYILDITFDYSSRYFIASCFLNGMSQVVFYDLSKKSVISASVPGYCNALTLSPDDMYCAALSHLCDLNESCSKKICIWSISDNSIQMIFDGGCSDFYPEKIYATLNSNEFVAVSARGDLVLLQKKGDSFTSEYLYSATPESGDCISNVIFTPDKKFVLVYASYNRGRRLKRLRSQKISQKVFIHVFDLVRKKYVCSTPTSNIRCDTRLAACINSKGTTLWLKAALGMWKIITLYTNKQRNILTWLYDLSAKGITLHQLCLLRRLLMGCNNNSGLSYAIDNDESNSNMFSSIVRYIGMG